MMLFSVPVSFYAFNGLYKRLGMSYLVPRGLAELFYGVPTITANRRRLPTNRRMVFIPKNLESEVSMHARLAADRQAALLQR
jgi:hypothetical protein